MNASDKLAKKMNDKLMWWDRETAKLEIFKMASCYIGPLVFLLGVLKVYSLKPLASIIAVFGIFETMKRAQHHKQDWLWMLSILGHIAVYIPYINQKCTIHSLIVSSLIGLVILGVYGYFDTWPYMTSPKHSFSLCLCIMLINCY